MNRRGPALRLALVLASASCAPDPSPVARPSAPGSDGVLSPLVARWVPRGAPRRDTTGRWVLALSAEIEQRGRVPAPVRVAVRAPAGVERVSGPESTVLAPRGPGAVDRVEYTFAYAAAPSGDLVLAVDCEAARFGAHAAVPWRFDGAPSTTTATPTAQGPRYGARVGLGRGALTVRPVLVEGRR